LKKKPSSLEKPEALDSDTMSDQEARMMSKLMFLIEKRNKNIEND